MTWTWRFESVDGTEATGPGVPTTPSYSNQSDAESWLGEQWRELADAGIAQVTLFEDTRKVYGPMSLGED